ncbi:MAG: UDP-N-acetylmuramoyl-L-alanyl-D-glutamate--2,6-diaminopimelate ligase [Bryobacteraceae bacterium]|nr:UDP-N-acetylmuramoyl-L-alanyl-D-glutamate--2,6-diaminopimelate ligase [Bryobacteraceae bacterium]
MTVGELLRGVALKSTLPPELARAQARGVEYDSRKVGEGDLFFAFEGKKHDGRRFAHEAIERGAAAVVSESARPEGFPHPWMEAEHGRRALALAARNLYGDATSQLAVTGITGTNGKTTTTYLADSILRAAGKKTALIGTIEYLLAGRPLSSINTTPESLDLYRLFAELAREGGTHVTMEASSHALALGRVHGVPFHTAVFTNLTRDHLDFHQTMEAYFEAKRLLFHNRDAAPPQYAALNRDDRWAPRIEPEAETRVIWYGLSAEADVRAENIESGFDGLRFDVVAEGARTRLTSPLLGKINVYNILAAFAVGMAHGVDREAIVRGVEACRAVPGRFERIEEGQPFLVVVDYAHTDDALRNVIVAARTLEPRRLITLFGCGGDRDRAKRPLMGEAAGSGSDFVVLTSDNPRSEDPLSIINDALVGLRRYDTPHRVEPNREAAIRLALSEANQGDFVLIAGKGHETRQVLKDGTIPFDDREVAQRLLRGFGYSKDAT